MVNVTVLHIFLSNQLFAKYYILEWLAKLIKQLNKSWILYQLTFLTAIESRWSQDEFISYFIFALISWYQHRGLHPKNNYCQFSLTTTILSFLFTIFVTLLIFYIFVFFWFVDLCLFCFFFFFFFFFVCALFAHQWHV